MNKKIRKLLTCLLTGIMAAGTAGNMSPTEIPAIEVFAEENGAKETLFDLNFDDGSLNGFQTYIEGGDCELKNENGELAVTIRNCGEVNYANQIYWEGFKLKEGCVYRFSFDIHSSIKRKLGYRIQLNGGNYEAYTSSRIESKPEVKHYDIEFTMNKKTDPAPRLCFNMGVQSDMKEDPGEHQVYLDNIQLVLVDDSGAVASAEDTEAAVYVSVNQTGYRPDDSKIAVTSADYAGMEFSVKDIENNETVYTGIFGSAFADKATKKEVCQGDFSDWKEDGIYRISVGEDMESSEFTIGEDVYNDLFRETFKMMYMQRCGVELTEEYAGAYAHPACHTTEAVIYGTDRTKEVNGGWHDAGDYGRYSVTAAKTAADFLLAYEDHMDEELISSDALGIPESGNGIPDILDEVKFELEWFLKMQDEESGGVYHKVSGYNFPGTVMPQDETAPLVLSPISATSTADFAAIMAKAAVDYKDVDAEFSAKCLDAAMKAWDYLQNAESLKGFTNPKDIFTGEYGDGSAKDEIYWAAVELYLAGEILETETVDVAAIPTSEPGADLGWIQMGAYGLYDLARANVTGEEIEKLKEKAQKQLLSRAEQIAEASEKDGYFVSLGMNYYWGSNMNVANNGMILLMADSLSENETYKLAAKRQLDYLLGVNGLGFSYVSGFGSRSMADPHHRPSQAVGAAVPGMLAGGPNPGLEDPYVKQVLKGLSAPGLCYVDNQQSYSTNEVAIYWNSPLVNLIAGI